MEMVSGLCQKESCTCYVLPFPALLGKGVQPTKQASELSSTELLVDAAAYPTRLSPPRNIAQTLQHKCSFLQVRALQQSWHLAFHLS